MDLNHPVIPLLGRLMMTYIFATSGIGKIFGWSGNVAYMSTRHLPMIPLLLAVAMVIEVVGSLCLVTGYQARIAAFVMFWYTTAVTVIFHNYWASSDMMAAMQRSEEHTSELQSRQYLVCRLLLEKKKSSNFRSEGEELVHHGVDGV